MAAGRPAIIHDRGEVEFLTPEATDEDDEELAPRLRFYKSEKLLGELFRRVDEKQIWDQDVRKVVPHGVGIVWDDFLARMNTRIEEIDSTLNYAGKWNHAWHLRNVCVPPPYTIGTS